MDALAVENLNKTFQTGLFSRKQVLKNVSFKVPDKSITGFVGVNGSGKTTSIKCLLNIIFPDSGEIKFWGNKSFNNNIKRKIGFLPERPYLYEYLTADEILKFYWKLNRSDDNFEKQVEKVLNEVGLQSNRFQRLRSFSKGMLQRIGLAIVLINQPQFLILDEPMSGLDPDGRILVKDIIRNLNQQEITIFFSTHLLADVEELCENLVVINQGEIKFSGKTTVFAKTGSLEAEFRKLRGVTLT